MNSVMSGTVRSTRRNEHAFVIFKRHLRWGRLLIVDFPIN